MIMRIAFTTVAVPGHLNSTTTLARRLKARGHDVVFIAVRDAEPFVNAAQLPFIPAAEREYPAGSVGKILDQLSKLDGQAAMEFTFRALGDALQSSFKNLPQTLLEARVDAVVLDQFQFGLGLVPMHLGMPYVHYSNAVHIDFSGNAPLCFFDWPHETTPAALARNHEGLRRVQHALEPVRAVARSYAEKVGLQIEWTDPFATISKLAWLTQMPKEFDFKCSHLPAQFHYTGPTHDGFGRIEPDFPWDRLTGEPLIYASMGTLQNGREPVFSAIAAAVGTRPGMQLVLSIGPRLDAKRIESLPADAIVVNSTPQLELLKRSTLCITHAGMNTTLESLTQGIPLVAIPVTNDQPGVAARIAYTKTGAFVPLQEMTVPRLSRLIDEVLGNPEYRRNANQMKETIAKTNGLEKAVDLLEEAFQLSNRTKSEMGSRLNSESFRPPRRAG
jgi:zeaxanthin glucosyltransferase